MEKHVHIPFVNLLQIMSNRVTLIYRMAYNNIQDELMDKDLEYPNDPEYVRATPKKQV